MPVKSRENRRFEIAPRSCPSCDQAALNSLCLFERSIATVHSSWHFSMPHVQCDTCGCIFVSPAPTQESLMEYYSDTLPVFAEQAPTYDTASRLDLLSELRNLFVDKECAFLELGANRTTEFHTLLEQQVTSVTISEPSRSSALVERVESGKKKFQIIAHYYVLEHVVDVQDFLTHCNSLLDENGIMICEVPNVLKYPGNISAFFPIEHTNHFTPRTLGLAAERAGFELLPKYSLEQYCSRSGFGSVSVFRKASRSLSTPTDQAEIELEKAAFCSGLAKLGEFETFMKETCERLSPDLEKTIFWAANEHAYRFLHLKESLKGRIQLIDSNPKKVGTVYDTEVILPEQASRQIEQAENIVLFTKTHKDAILKDLDQRFAKRFAEDKVFVLDWYGQIGS